jgi:hypothetical protein
MMSTTTSSERGKFLPTPFLRYIEQLEGSCRANPDVTGLVLMGSTAHTGRADEWSDHDFAVVCRSGRQEALRGDLSWLPRFVELAFVAREHHDGFKGVYADGAVIEFAVVDASELATFSANAYRVAYDAEGTLDGIMQSAALAPRPSGRVDSAREFRLFLALILIGVGRYRRGEALSASASIRGEGLDHLLNALTALVSSPDRAAVDDLDVRRRLERAYPTLTALHRTLDQDVELCARSLLITAERELAPVWRDYPSDSVAVVRKRLGWPVG